MGAAPLALVACRLLPWKGVALAIDSLRHLPDWQLRIVGSGPDDTRLRARAAELGLAGRVQFTGWLPRDNVLDMMRDEADVLLFPSLHDEGSWSVAEARACGLPVVCLDRGGPPVLGGVAVRASTPKRIARAIAIAARKEVASAGRPVDDTWSFNRRRDALVALLGERGLLLP